MIVCLLYGLNRTHLIICMHYYLLVVKNGQGIKNCVHISPLGKNLLISNLYVVSLLIYVLVNKWHTDIGENKLILQVYDFQSLKIKAGPGPG